jgi:hypothetical protein
MVFFVGIVLIFMIRIGQQLRKDQAHVLKPDFKSRFLTRGDAIKRLTRYHVLTKPAPPAYEPTDDECRQCKISQIFIFIILRLFFS